jgi:hypothetical protein
MKGKGKEDRKWSRERKSYSGSTKPSKQKNSNSECSKKSMLPV